eukprot:1810146-Ditylum_brightwellii.AAC.1
MKIGLHNISNIKCGSAGFCKTQLQETLMGADVKQGAHAIATGKINGVKLLALAYRGKSNRHKKQGKEGKLLQLLCGNQ